MKKRIMSIICIAMAAGVIAPVNFVAAEEKEASGLKDKRIGVCLVYKGDEWCSAVADEFEKQAKELGVEVNIQDGNLDAETQTKQIENFIAQEYDLIAVDPANADGIVPALEKAKEANIPLVFFDNNANYEDIVSYVTWDSYETGKIIGEYLHDKIETEMEGKANIAVLTMATPVNIQTRIEGVKDALKDLDITYVSEQEYE
ncbi:MAG: sugar ABC transporter substrate-binding protein, partial [Bacillota bacterium]|nr:sugar ABC transporter substrate-binding protein [Bacillota bacterium]